MKKIINGKIYNTDTAERLHLWNNGHFRSDFQFYNEALYQTKRGAFFLCGDGGAMSKYSVVCGNGRTGGTGIIPMSRLEAARWLETHDGEEALETYFSDMIKEA